MDLIYFLGRAGEVQVWKGELKDQSQVTTSLDLQGHWTTRHHQLLEQDQSLGRVVWLLMTTPLSCTAQHLLVAPGLLWLAEQADRKNGGKPEPAGTSESVSPPPTNNNL